MSSEFQTLVNSLAMTLGLEAQGDDFERVCWEVDGMQLTIEYLSETGMVWLHAPVGTVDDSLKKEAVLRIFLAQYFLRRTFGCTLTLEKDGQFLVHFQYPLSRLNNVDFEHLVDSFVNLMEVAKERIQKPLIPYPETQEKDKEMPFDFLMMSAFRV